MSGDPIPMSASMYLTTCPHGVDLRFVPRCWLCKPETATLIVKFSADATPEEVETARDQIDSLFRIDRERLLRALRAWDDQHTETSADAIADAYEADAGA